jgi:hypothetical protein
MDGWLHIWLQWMVGNKTGHNGWLVTILVTMDGWLQIWMVGNKTGRNGWLVKNLVTMDGWI